MANLGPKGEGDNSMPGKQRSCPGARGEALRGPCDMAKARLPKPQSPDDATEHPPEIAPVTGAAACTSLVSGLVQPLGRKAMPNEGIEGDEWGAYVTLGRTKKDERGDAYGARAPRQRSARSSREGNGSPRRTGKPSVLG